MSNYYKNFYKFQEELNFSLRIFSLNYDLCLEKNRPKDFDLERGFDENKIWDWRRFEDSDYYQAGIYLYKLHGSIDWKRDKKQGNLLKYVEGIYSDPDLIFGTDYKMQYIDPYLFFAYEFRKYSLESRIILILGYGFNDEHINGIIKQALENDSSRKIVSISPGSKVSEICDKLKFDNKINTEQVITIQKTAKTFLNQELHLKFLKRLI